MYTGIAGWMQNVYLVKQRPFVHEFFYEENEEARSKASKTKRGLILGENFLRCSARINFLHMFDFLTQNDFAEGFKILLDTDQMIMLDHQNNFVGILKIISKKLWYSSNWFEQRST